MLPTGLSSQKAMPAWVSSVCSTNAVNLPSLEKCRHRLGREKEEAKEKKGRKRLEHCRGRGQSIRTRMLREAWDHIREGLKAKPFAS